MSGYQRRPYLPAVVGPRASRVLVREFGEQLRRYATSLAGSPKVENQETAEEVMRAIASMQESARQLGQRERGSDDGTAEPMATPDAPRSDRPPLGLSSREVADRLDVSTSYVTRQCRLGGGGGLSGVLVGRTWVIDPESVATYGAARRLEHDG